MHLAPDIEPLDQRLITPLIDLLQIVEKTTALADHLEEAAARMVVLLVGFEVIGERIDALGEDRNLDFGRTRVNGLGGIFFDERGFALLSHGHSVISKWVTG